jgi:tryptophan synthase alpha subunit
VAGFADAVVVGSRLVQESESGTPESLVNRVHDIAADFRRAMDGRKV